MPTFDNFDIHAPSPFSLLISTTYALPTLASVLLFLRGRVPVNDEDFGRREPKSAEARD
jgi:hypothetical protein